jgi:hypothetical protein
MPFNPYKTLYMCIYIHRVWFNLCSTCIFKRSKYLYEPHSSSFLIIFLSSAEEFTDVRPQCSKHYNATWKQKRIGAVHIRVMKDQKTSDVQIMRKQVFNEEISQDCNRELKHPKLYEESNWYEFYTKITNTWSRVLFRKLRIAQLFVQVHISLRYRKFQCRVHKNWQLDLFWTNSIQSTSSHPVSNKIHLNIKCHWFQRLSATCLSVKLSKVCSL